MEKETLVTKLQYFHLLESEVFEQHYIYHMILTYHSIIKHDVFNANETDGEKWEIMRCTYIKVRHPTKFKSYCHAAKFIYLGSEINSDGKTETAIT
jgi:hypothetical protein